MALDPIGTQYKGAPEKFPTGGYYRGIDGRYYVWRFRGKNQGGPVWTVQDANPALGPDAFSMIKVGKWLIPSDAPSSPTFKPPVVENDEPAPAPMSLSFPADMKIGFDSDYVMFDFYNYRPPFQGRSDINDEQALNATLAQYNSSRYDEEYKRDETFPQIRLYMPDDIQDAFKADWQGKAFGGITAGLLASAGADTIKKKVEGAFKTLGDSLNKAPINAAANTITKLSSGITGDSITADDVFGGISGVVRNPNTELLFEKMNLRTFDLTFKMAPYSVEDSEQIDQIINNFKKAMLPRYALGDAKVFGYQDDQNGAIQAGFIKVPMVCQVSYMTGSARHAFLPKYKKCAITDFKVNYTPDNNYASLNNTFPVAVEINISFLETKLVFAEDIDPTLDPEFHNTAPSGQQYGPMGSDVRLKENITKVGNSPSGINIYEWNYKSAPDTRYRGVMAHEILEAHPEAVALEPDGYMSVFYGKIDVNMERVK